MAHDKVYRERVIRLCEIAGDEGIIDGAEFYDCHVRGPAILVLQGKGTLANNELRGVADAILWLIPESRPVVVGPILAKECIFDGCTFENVGFAGPQEFINTMRDSMGL